MTVKDDRVGFDELQRTIRTLDRTVLEVGIFGDESSEVLLYAMVHEFGAPRANIPARSFIRAGFDHYQWQITDRAVRLLQDVLSGKTSLDAYMDALGVYVVGRLQQYLIDLQTPPLKPATIRKKGSSNPLVDTGRMVQSISYRVVSR